MTGGLRPSGNVCLPPFLDRKPIVRNPPPFRHHLTQFSQVPDQSPQARRGSDVSAPDRACHRAAEDLDHGRGHDDDEQHGQEEQDQRHGKLGGQ